MCFFLYFKVICERKVICVMNIRDMFLYYLEKDVDFIDEV